VLESKAKDLWKWAEKQAEFIHLQMTGDSFLSELRKLFSVNLLERSIRSAVPAGSAINPTFTDIESLDNDSLYSLRRDLCGVPPGTIPRKSEPDLGMADVSRVHLALKSKGAVLTGAVYQMQSGLRVKLVNGQTRLLSQVKKEFEVAPATADKHELVICAGAVDDGSAASNIVRASSPRSVLRGGSGARWTTLEAAEREGLL
jgi:hypothetical protein